jgi:hypothetical protein
MKLKTPMLVTLFAVGLAAALALAAPQAGHGKPLADAPATTTTASTLTTTTSTNDHRSEPTTTTVTTTTAPPATTTAPETPLVVRAGVITVLGPTISVDGLTCSLAAPPPNLGEFKLGDSVYIGCASGVLVKIFRQPSQSAPATTATTTTTTTEQTVTKEDRLLALSGTSVTVGPLTCAVTSGSPSVAGVKVGDRVGIVCSGGVLVRLELLPPLPAYPPAPAASIPSGFTAQLGTITSLNGASISVGSLSCTIGDGSPDVSGFHVGDAVGIGCAHGVLFMIGKLPLSVAPAATPLIKHELAERYRACVKAGVSATTDAGLTCRIADILKRKKKRQL